MLTSDYAEALEMSHRILVMRREPSFAISSEARRTKKDLLREAIGEITNMASTGPALEVSPAV